MALRSPGLKSRTVAAIILAMSKTLFAAGMALLLGLLALWNSSPITLRFLAWTFEAPLFSVVILSFALGLISGSVFLRPTRKKTSPPKNDG